MLKKIFILTLAFTMTISAPAPAPHPEPHPAPAADPAPKPGLTPLLYSSPVAVSYNAFSTVQAHPSVVVKSAPAAAVVPTVQAMPTVYTLQAQAAPAVGYAVNYPYVVV